MLGMSELKEKVAKAILITMGCPIHSINGLYMATKECSDKRSQAAMNVIADWIKEESVYYDNETSQTLAAFQSLEEQLRGEKG